MAHDPWTGPWRTEPSRHHGHETQGKFDDDMILDDGSKMEFEAIYPLDAVFDTPEQASF